MQYLWAAWRPEYRSHEIVAHGGLYYTGGLNEDFDVKQPQARDDNYLVLLSLFLTVETSDVLQWALSNTLFVYLGRRSLSKSPGRKSPFSALSIDQHATPGFFLMQSIITYTLGIKLYQTLHITNDISAIAVCFFVTLATSLGIAEIFYRIVEVPSHVLSHVAFDWIRE
jgi:hypothetical protein